MKMYAGIFIGYYVKNRHRVKSVRIRSYSGPYSVQMRENTDENNSEYGHFSRSDDFEGKALCYEHEPDGVIVNEMYKILWDSTIQCDIKIENRRPNIDIIDKTKREVKSMDINIPRDVRMNGREKGKTKKYKMLKG